MKSFVMVAFAVVLAGAQALAAPAPAGPDRVYIDGVLDAMVESGIITQDQADKLKARGQSAADSSAASKAAVPSAKKWFDTMKVGGYAQGRYMYYLDDLSTKDANGDSHKIGSEFLTRRARIAVEAKPSSTSKVYVQIDGGGGSVSIKDAWAEVSIKPDLAARIRVGQQKVPFGFEVPQSSSVRLPLERNWVTRRTILEERDTGITAFYTLPEDKALFEMGKSEFWAPGDYGNVSLSIFNGQAAGEEAMEVNDDKHVALRVCKPFEIESTGGYAEVGASYYFGEYYSAKAEAEFDENLLGIHAYLAPAPFGVQAEYFTGETEGHDLDGWYVMGMAKTNPGGTAFVRYDDFNGWRKGANAAYDRHRLGVGYAYQLDSKTRLTLQWDQEDIDTSAGGSADQIGMQLMVNY